MASTQHVGTFGGASELVSVNSLSGRHFRGRQKGLHLDVLQ